MNWRGLVGLAKLLASLALIIGIGYLAAFRTDWFLLSGFEVQANVDNRGWIEENFGSYYRDKNIFLVSLEEGAEGLRGDPAVKKAEITRRFPNQLVYRIEYRIPVTGIWFDDKVLMVDDDGYLVSTSPEPVETIPVIYGFPMESFVVGKPIEATDKQHFKMILELVALLHKAGLSEACSIKMEDQTAVVDLKSGISGRFWYRGNTTDSFNRFISVYNDQVSKGVTAGLIDVSSEGYPVYKPFGE